jgi:dipeptidase E
MFSIENAFRNDASVFTPYAWHAFVWRLEKTVKLLLTSSGITNPSIQNALVSLLDKPIAESNALFIPTGMYPFPGGGTMALEAVRGRPTSPLSDLGWKSIGLLELTALPSIQRESWVPTVGETDALLVWGGNVMYLNYWMRKSGLADVLPTLEQLVYVGVSAGSIVTTTHSCDFESNLEFVPHDSDMALAKQQTLGIVDFTMWVHVENPNPIFEDHTMANVEKWASGVPVPTYAIDDQTAIKVEGDSVEVVTEGRWRVFTPKS